MSGVGGGFSFPTIAATDMQLEIGGHRPARRRGHCTLPRHDQSAGSQAVPQVVTFVMDVSSSAPAAKGVHSHISANAPGNLAARFQLEGVDAGREVLDEFRVVLLEARGRTAAPRCCTSSRAPSGAVVRGARDDGARRLVRRTLRWHVVRQATSSADKRPGTWPEQCRRAPRRRPMSRRHILRPCISDSSPKKYGMPSDP